MLNSEQIQESKELSLKKDGAILLGGNPNLDKIVEEHLKQRKIILNDEVDENVVENIILQILKWNAEDKYVPVEDRKVIRIYISSCGGDVFSGLGVIDVIVCSKTPVHGIVLTNAYSMAGVIFVSCHKRFMLESATVLIHDGSMSLSGSANKMKDLQKFYDKIDDKLKHIIIGRTSITEKEYEANADRELYLLSDECKEKGICDGIVGVDISLDEIL